MVTLKAVGDLMLGDHPLMVGRGIAELTDARDENYPFGGVGDALDKSNHVGVVLQGDC